MKLIDCFMYFDEDLVLDIRLNTLNEKVDKFIIAEATKNHAGKPKKLITFSPLMRVMEIAFIQM